MRVYHRLSGIVGVVAVTALLSPMVSGVAYAEPDPPTPTIIEMPGEPAPAPAPDTGSGTPSGPPAGDPAPAPAPVPPPPPPAPAPVPIPAPQAPPAPAPPAPVVPDPVDVPPAPAPPAGNQGQTPAGPPAPSGGSVDETPPTADEPSSDDSSLPSGGTSQPNLPSGNGQNGQASESEGEADQLPASQPGASVPDREGSEGTETGVPPVAGSEEEGQQDIDQTPAESGTVSGEQNGTPSEGSSPAEGSGQNASDPNAGSTPEVVTEELSKPTEIVPEPEAQLVSMEALKKVEQPAETKQASPEVVEEALASLADTARAADRDNDNQGRDRDHRDHDPKGWKCDDRRGAYGCPWDQWGHDDRGRPEFYNRFSFDLKVVYWDGYTNVEVIVRAGTRQWIDPRSPGAYAFVVVGVSNPDFRLNVGVGVFTSGRDYGHGNGNCGINPRYCQRPSVTEINVFVSVTNTRYDRLRAYDCGCRTRYMDRDYDRVYIGGSREVIGHWNRPRTQFQPVYIRENPTSPAYVPVTPQSWNDVVDGGEPKGGDPSAATTTTAASSGEPSGLSDGKRAMIIIVIIGAGAALIWAYVQHVRRRTTTS